MGSGRKRKSPRLHEVRTRHPRYHLGSYPRGNVSASSGIGLSPGNSLYAMEQLPPEQDLIKGYLPYKSGVVEARLTRGEWATLQQRLRGADSKLRRQILDDMLSGVERLPRYRVRHYGSTHIHHAFDYPPMFKLR